MIVYTSFMLIVVIINLEKITLEIIALIILGAFILFILIKSIEYYFKL